MVVYTGPKQTGSALIAAVAADSEKQATPRRGKKSRIAAKKPDAAARSRSRAKPNPVAKPAAVRHANAKPDAAAAKPAEKPAATADKPAAETGQAQGRRKAQKRNQARQLINAVAMLVA